MEWWRALQRTVTRKLFFASCNCFKSISKKKPCSPKRNKVDPYRTHQVCVCCESKIVSIAVERFWTGVIWDSCKLKVYISFQSTSIMKYYINKYIHLPLFICVLGNWILFAKHKTVFHVARTDCIQSAVYRIFSSTQLFCPLQCHPFIGNLSLFKPVHILPRLWPTRHHTLPTLLPFIL